MQAEGLIENDIKNPKNPKNPKKQNAEDINY
jgi:hypothetical protein